MDPAQVAHIGRELLYTAVILSAPTVIVSLLVGLVISIFQTVTSIQEQTLSFAPRIIAVVAVIAATLPWTLEVLIDFSRRMFWLITETHM
jgi:flagellar biosynthetic protein FliQ